MQNPSPIELRIALLARVFAPQDMRLGRHLVRCRNVEPGVTSIRSVGVGVFDCNPVGGIIFQVKEARPTQNVFAIGTSGIVPKGKSEYL